MKKLLKVLSLTLIAIIIGLFTFYLIKNEKLPQGESGAAADAMAESMLTAMNKTAWDTTQYVQWTFRGAHDYEWDKAEHKVKVSWDEFEVILDPAQVEGVVVSSQDNLSIAEQDRLVKTAWDFFNNDSFWLAAPYKVFDPGTERSIVTCADGRTGLKVTYTSGGSTPGDSYVWILGPDNRPVACKMWVSILPIGGMEFSWENYQTLQSGALIALDHKMMGLMNVTLDNVKNPK